jgi:hypothetical protein
MSEPDPLQPSLSHAQTIESYENRYRGAQVAVFVSVAHTVPEGLVLLGGMHRACALYRLAPPTLDASVAEFSPWPGDHDTQPGPRDKPLS